MPHHRQTRPAPNVQDPLSEPTLHRRIWAAYLAVGYNRATWADALDMSYKAVDLLDTGKNYPRLGTLMRMQELIGVFTLDELVYGRNPPRLNRTEAELSTDAIKALLHEMKASVDAIEALGQHVESPAGKFQRYTRSYVVAFMDRYQLARDEGLDRAAAIDAAKQTAANARANAEAVAARLKPVSAAQLAALGQKLKAESEHTGTMPTTPKKKRRRA